MVKKEGIFDENFECIPLDWDTDYFGVNSARVNLSGIIDDLNQTRIIDFCKNYEFVTISNVGNIKENNQWIGQKTNAFLTDMNIQFLKGIHCEPDINDEYIEIYNAYPRDMKIIQIAHSSFLYSRFFNDTKLPKHEAENIYVHWTESAFGKKNKYFIISRKNDEVSGYILFSLDRVRRLSTIELIAVDEKFRGQRVGKLLILGMESYVYKNNIDQIKVGTQVDNISAVQFYTAVGFKYVSCGTVYHWWH